MMSDPASETGTPPPQKGLRPMVWISAIVVIEIVITALTLMLWSSPS